MHDQLSDVLTLAITTYNRPSECLSCIKASYHVISTLKYPIRLLVVDDCSLVTPELKQLFLFLKHKNITCIKHSVNLGLAASRNTAISHCHTDWIAFCDDDDMWSSKSFDLFLSAIFTANKRNIRAILGLASPTSRCGYHKYKDYTCSLSDLFLAGITPPPSSQLYKMNTLTSSNRYNTNLKTGIDHDIWVSLLASSNPSVLIIVDPGVYVSNSLTNRMTTDYFVRSTALQLSLATWKPTLTKHLSEEFYTHFAQCYMQSHKYQFFIHFLRTGKYLKSVRLLFSSKVIFRLLRRILKGPIARINYFDPFKKL
jgi:glycosyltransferase involved in cell wall biosynthesis